MDDNSNVSPSQFLKNKKYKLWIYEFVKYLGSLIDIGYGTNTEKATIIILVVSSLLLTGASGYTTYSGLLEYTHPFIAFIITTGIQSLLFASSWRLGYLFVIKEMNYSIIFIWLITLSVSVFFSFSSLFKIIYENEKSSHSDIYAAKEVRKILFELNNKNIVNFESDFERDTFSEWKTSIFSTLSIVQSLLAEKEENILENYKYSLKLFNQELQSGGTPLFKDSENKFINSLAGTGDLYESYNSLSEFFKDNLVKNNDDINTKLKESFNTFESNRDINELLKIHQMFDKYINDFLLNSKLFQTEYLNLINKFNNKYNSTIEREISKYNNVQKINFNENVYFKKVIKNSLLNEVDEYKIIDIYRKIYNKLRINIDYINNKINTKDKFDNACSSNFIKKEFSKDLSLVQNCVSMLDLNTNELNKYLERINIIEKYEGKRTHHFIVVMNQFERLNPLAIGTLSLAFMIDILILLCSLLGSKHETFLGVDKTDDFLYMSDKPLHVIFSTVYEIDDKKDSTSVKKIKNLLNNLTLDLKSLYGNKTQGYGLTIDSNKIDELKLNNEIALLLTMQFARKVNLKNTENDNTDIIGLQTGFVLWMCDEIEKQSNSRNTYNSFETLIKGEYNEQ